MSDSLQVPAPDLGAAAASAQRRATLTPGSLGQTAAWVEALAALRRSPGSPVTPTAPTLVVFAADHGITLRQVTGEFPAESARAAGELAASEGTTGRLAARAGVRIDVTDVGLTANESPTGVRDERVRKGSEPIDVADALTLDEVARAIQIGRDTADRLIAEGADLFIAGLCGVGVDVSAAAIASHLTGMEPIEVSGRGTGVDDAGWCRRAAAVRDARYRLGTGSGDAATLLRVAGGTDLAALTGFILQAALSGVPTMVDDVPSTVAAVLAHRFAPGAERYTLVPGPRSESVHGRLLGLLGIDTLTALDLGTGLAMPSLLLFPLLSAATTAVDTAPAQPGPNRVATAIDDWDRALF